MLYISYKLKHILDNESVHESCGVQPESRWCKVRITLRSFTMCHETWMRCITINCTTRIKLRNAFNCEISWQYRFHNCIKFSSASVGREGISGHTAAFLPLIKSIIVMTVNLTVIVRLVARSVTVIAVVAVNRWLVNLRMIVRDRCRGSYVIVSRQMRGSRSGHFRRVYYATLKTEETMRKWRAALNSQCSYVWLSFNVVKLFSNWLLQFPLFKNRVKFIFENLWNFEHVNSTFNNNISLLLNVPNMKSTSRYKKRKEKWKKNFILLIKKLYVISSTTRRSWSNYKLNTLLGIISICYWKHIVLLYQTTQLLIRLNGIKILLHDLTGQAARDIRIRCDTSDDQPIRASHIRDSCDFPCRDPRYVESSRQLPPRRRDAPLWHVLLPACPWPSHRDLWAPVVRGTGNVSV